MTTLQEQITALLEFHGCSNYVIAKVDAKLQPLMAHLQDFPNLEVFQKNAGLDFHFCKLTEKWKERLDKLKLGKSDVVCVNLPRLKEAFDFWKKHGHISTQFLQYLHKLLGDATQKACNICDDKGFYYSDEGTETVRKICPCKKRVA